MTVKHASGEAIYREVICEMSKQHNRKGCYDDVILPSSGREAICAHWPYADTGLTSAIKTEETISASPQQDSLRLQHAKQVILQ